MNYKAQSGQSMMDIAMMTYGNLDNIVKLANDAQVTVGEENISGKTFEYDSSFVTDESFSKKIITSKIVYATAKNLKGAGFSLGFDIGFES